MLGVNVNFTGDANSENPWCNVLLRCARLIFVCLLSGHARGNVRQERERGHQAETSSGHRGRGHVSYIACASLLLPPCIIYLPYDRITLIHFYRNSGINRLTKNIELALPIINDAFR